VAEINLAELKATLDLDYRKLGLSAKKAEAQVARTVKNIEKNKAEITIVANLRKLGVAREEAIRQARQIAKELDEQFASGGDKAGRGFGRRLALGIAKTRIDVGGLTAGLGKQLVVPALLLGLKLAAAGAVSLSAGLVSVAAAATPAVGALGALPGVLIAVGTTAVALKVTTSRATEAATAITKYGASSKQAVAALKPLGAEGRTFAAQLVVTQKALRKLQTVGEAATLPGLGKGLSSASTLLPIVAKNFRELGGVIGGAAVEAGRFAASGPFRRDFGAILSVNTGIVATLTKAIRPATQALVDLVVSAAPLAKQFAAFAVSSIQSVAGFISIQRVTGGLSSFFIKAGETAQQLGRIVANLGKGLFAVFSAGAPAGAALLKIVEGLTAKFKTFALSASGQASITAQFQNAIPVIIQVSGLISDVVKLFAGLATDQSLVPLIAQIRSQFIPALSALTTSVSSGDTAKSLVNVATALANFTTVVSAGPILAAANALAVIVIQVSQLIAQVPGLGTLIGSLFLAQKLFGATKFAGDVSGISAVIKKLGEYAAAKRAAAAAEGTSVTTQSVARLQQVGAALQAAAVGAGKYAKEMAVAAVQSARTAAATALAAAKTVILTAVQRVAAIATGIWTVVQLALDAALSPVGLIVIAVAAGIALLVGGFILAYKKSETFRNIIQSLGKFLSVTGQIIAVIVVGSFRALVSVIKVAIGWVVRFATFVGRETGKIVGWFQGVARSVGGAVSRFSNFLIGGIRSVLRFELRIRNALVGAIKSFFSFASRVTAPLSSFAGAVGRFVGRAVGFFSGIQGRILGALSGLGSALYNAGAAAIQAFANGIISNIRRATDAASTLLNKLKGFFHQSPPKAGPLSGQGDTYYSGRRLVDAYAAGIRGRIPVARTAASDLARGVSGIGRRAGGTRSQGAGLGLAAATGGAVELSDRSIRLLASEIRRGATHIADPVAVISRAVDRTLGLAGLGAA
jgi:hypothetical protein